MLALIEVESENNPVATGKANDCGLLQITPVYVKEVNRIQSKNIFTPEDRFDIRKSFDMFNAMNDFYNKDRDIEKAIRLHNPQAPASYRAKIMKKIAEIKKREAVRKYCVKPVTE
jgi:soluble lytic murein transglycosylase-like protein